MEQALSQWVGDDAPAGLGEAMRYAVLDGGKRLRPLLVLAAYEAAQRPRSAASARLLRCEAALRAACAVELIHAYSLVHDDMPCMDNDVLRRGKPTVHVQFGEAQALLAGDALQALAFELLTPDDARSPPPCRRSCAACWPLAAGRQGMAGGQAIDLASVGVALTRGATAPDAPPQDRRACCRPAWLMGAACGHAGAPRPSQALSDYGAALGLAFQVVDDILDVVAGLGHAGQDRWQGRRQRQAHLRLAAGSGACAGLCRRQLLAAGPCGPGAPVACPTRRALAALADMVVRRSH